MNQAELKEALTQVTWLREAASQGLLFPTLATELSALQASLPIHSRTPVQLPGVTTAERAHLTSLFAQANRKSWLSNMTTADWELVVAQLGSGDPKIRLDMAVPIFNAAVAGQRQSESRLTYAWGTMASEEGLFAHVDEPKNQACVVRATAVTGLAMMLYADRKGQSYLMDRDVTRLIDQVILGLLWERDHRGYVNHLGWVQIFGEYTLLLNELNHRQYVTRGEKVLLMAAYLTAYRRLRGPLIMGESEEGADYLVRMLVSHPLYRRFFIRFLREWQGELTQLRPKNKGDWDRVFNYRRLMQGMLMHPELPEKVAHQITEQPQDPGQ